MVTRTRVAKARTAEYRWRRTSRWRQVPRQVHGRVLSLAALVTFGLAPLGFALTPLAAGRFGIPAVGLFAAAVNVATSYAVLSSPAFPISPHPGRRRWRIRARLGCSG